jgi:hypothetical protein
MPEATKPDSLELPKYNIVKAETLGTPNSILIYGPPGKGKTVFAGSIVDVPGFQRVLVVDTEGSTVALGPWYPEADVIHARTAKDFNDIIEDLVNGKLVEPVSKMPYQAVVIDTLDKAQERQLEVFAKSPEARNKQGENNEFYKWGAIKIWTSKVADALHQAPFLTIWVMHEDVDKNEDTGKVTTTVMLAGKSQQIFPSVPDIVTYFNILNVEADGKKTQERVADFRASDKLVAKQRFADKLDGAIVDPTMVKVFEKIEPKRFKK